MAGRGHTADKSRIGWDKQAARGGGKGAMEPMTIKRRPKPSPRRRPVAALLVAAGVLGAGAGTPARPTPPAATPRSLHLKAAAAPPAPFPPSEQPLPL